MHACVLVEVCFDCDFSLRFVMDYVLQFGKRVHYHHYFLLYENISLNVQVQYGTPTEAVQSPSLGTFILRVLSNATFKKNIICCAFKKTPK